MGGPEEAICRGTEWLARRQRRDGGWSPGPAVEQSTHVTSMAVLALSGAQGYEEMAERGVEWIISQAGAETTVWARMARLTVGIRYWRDGTYGMAVVSRRIGMGDSDVIGDLRLVPASPGKVRGSIAGRLAEARKFLVDRRCPDHGWNHGGLYQSGEMPMSYPETTGIALLALAGSTAELETSLRCAERHAADPKVGGRCELAAAGSGGTWTKRRSRVGAVSRLDGESDGFANAC